MFIVRQLRYQYKKWTLLDFVPRLLGAVCVKLILQPQLLIMQCTQTGLKAVVQPTTTQWLIISFFRVTDILWFLNICFQKQMFKIVEAECEYLQIKYIPFCVLLHKISNLSYILLQFYFWVMVVSWRSQILWRIILSSLTLYKNYMVLIGENVHVPPTQTH